MKKFIENYDEVLVEPKCSKGHINFYREYISKLIKDGKKVLLVSTEEYNSKFSDIIGLNFQVISTKYHSDNVLSYRLQQLIALSELLLLLKSIRCLSLTFLSYEIISLSFFSKFYRSSFFVIEHNNIDDAENNKIKRFFYNFISKRVTHLVFEEYIQEHIITLYSKKSKTISHPLRKIESNNSFHFQKDYIFCPSLDCDKEFLLELVEFCNAHGYILVTKDKFDLSDFENVVQKKFFEDYDNVFLNAKYIAVGVKFDYRISGVFYEAIANSKLVIMQKCLFSDVMKDKHPESVKLILGMSDQNLLKQSI